MSGLPAPIKVNDNEMMPAFKMEEEKFLKILKGSPQNKGVLSMSKFNLTSLRNSSSERP